MIENETKLNSFVVIFEVYNTDATIKGVQQMKNATTIASMTAVSRASLLIT